MLCSIPSRIFKFPNLKHKLHVSNFWGTAPFLAYDLNCVCGKHARLFVFGLKNIKRMRGMGVVVQHAWELQHRLDFVYVCFNHWHGHSTELDSWKVILYIHAKLWYISGVYDTKGIIRIDPCIPVIELMRATVSRIDEVSESSLFKFFTIFYIL